MGVTKYLLTGMILQVPVISVFSPGFFMAGKFPLLQPGPRKSDLQQRGAVGRGGVGFDLVAWRWKKNWLVATQIFFIFIPNLGEMIQFY